MRAMQKSRVTRIVLKGGAVKHMKFKLSPGHMIALGFVAVITAGALLLLLPISRHPGVALSPVDALFTAASATCVTGLGTVDIADTFSTFGQAVVALLIQTGGLGIACVSVWLILFLGGRVSLKNRLLVKESWNVPSFRGTLPLVRSVLLLTLFFEGVGAIVGYAFFSRHYPWAEALKISVFHSISAFNNAGLDLLGGMQSLTPFRAEPFLNLLTAGLIIAGGLGFLVLLEVGSGTRPDKWTLHTKAVLGTSVVLIAAGTIAFRLTEGLPWLDAFFQSVSSRTAGFSTVSIGAFSNAGLFLLCLLMFIGASPGSTGGGIKTTTAFVLLRTLRGLASGKPIHAHRRGIPQNVVTKAFLVLLVSFLTVCVGTVLLCLFEPELPFLDCLVEVVSAFATVGLSTGITPGLGLPAKLLLTVMMYIGRIGPLTVISLTASRTEPGVRYSEEGVMVG